ncbi:hypothetical protein [Zoogloea sp.]|uniref:hypothetical protein n=1 Tax=Zoogloea sp. TaxID=49181 RepID=UPI0035AEA4BF
MIKVRPKTIRKFEAVTKLKPQFLGEPPISLKRKARGKCAIRNLSFVAGPRTVSDAPFWNVPPTGGYVGGYETGEAMALEFLKAMRENEDGVVYFWLTAVVGALMVRYEQEGGVAMARRKVTEQSPRFSALRGQYVGFFNLLSRWLSASAKHLGTDLDDLTEKELLLRANAGLGFDSAAYEAFMYQWGNHDE